MDDEVTDNGRPRGNESQLDDGQDEAGKGKLEYVMSKAEVSQGAMVKER